MRSLLFKFLSISFLSLSAVSAHDLEISPTQREDRENLAHVIAQNQAFERRQEEEEILARQITPLSEEEIAGFATTFLEDFPALSVFLSPTSLYARFINNPDNLSPAQQINRAMTTFNQRYQRYLQNGGQGIDDIPALIYFMNCRFYTTLTTKVAQHLIQSPEYADPRNTAYFSAVEQLAPLTSALMKSTRTLAKELTDSYGDWLATFLQAR